MIRHDRIRQEMKRQGQLDEYRNQGNDNVTMTIQ